MSLIVFSYLFTTFPNIPQPLQVFPNEKALTPFPESSSFAFRFFSLISISITFFLCLLTKRWNSPKIVLIAAQLNWKQKGDADYLKVFHTLLNTFKPRHIHLYSWQYGFIRKGREKRSVLPSLQNDITHDLERLNMAGLYIQIELWPTSCSNLSRKLTPLSVIRHPESHLFPVVGTHLELQSWY